ncbi:uncharacterized protein LOC121513793 [Cheilinus undulatus]|uniref:uncharacterized protein LOC121513793 n=1 Tax=Cheilinus undulatus TaxID=241271 RepID=UPI001BD5DC7A|nr:uncharacterized protein LOC121513793 [Cheilinus undulatus]
MGRQCYCPGCKNTSGLHSFPADQNFRLQWFRALGLSNRELPPRAGLCNRHFSRDCFSNLIEVDMGFTKVAKLKPNAVPNVALPVQTTGRRTVQPLRPLAPLKIQPKRTTEMGSQTERVLNKHAFVQADVKPYRRSKAIQAHTPTRDVSCGTRTFTAVPEALASAEGPRYTLVRRTTCELSTEDSNHQLDGANTMNYKSTSNEAAKFVVLEENLMELFRECPVCSRSCDITKTVLGTLLHVTQSCAHCDYFYQWSSQPMVKKLTHLVPSDESEGSIQRVVIC